MSVLDALGRWLGIGDLRSIESVDPSFGAAWAQRAPAWALFGALGLAALGCVHYLAGAGPERRRWRWALSACRAAVLAGVFFSLAEPRLVLHVVTEPRPLLAVLVDGTESMAIDDLPSPASPSGRRSRLEAVREFLSGGGARVLDALSEKFRLRAYLLDRGDGVRAVEVAASTAPAGAALGAACVRVLDAEGKVTALGSALEDLARRPGAGQLAGVIIISDFDQNSGPPPAEVAARLRLPIYAIGVGSTATRDAAVELHVPGFLRRGQRSVLAVALRQRGLDGVPLGLRVTARRADPGAAAEGAGEAELVIIEEAALGIDGEARSIEAAFSPGAAGRYRFEAELRVPVEDALAWNNRSAVEAVVRDEFLRLTVIEHEPTWEWRFLKETFQRDDLVGPRGFRTYLRSADPRVRQSDPLYLAALALERRSFFPNDVIIVGDLPPAALGSRFAELAREWVSDFGGGLVFLSGPRFGLSHLTSSSLAELLPVVPDPEYRARAAVEFRPQLASQALSFDFIRLGGSESEAAKVWDEFGPLAWYQPSARVHPLATVLLRHPQDVCDDGKTPQPLAAIRRFGRGEVVYLAFNELWRLRRQRGPEPYRAFWSLLLQRLSGGRALGAAKRFVVKTDRDRYSLDDAIEATVEAYDADYHPLSAAGLSGPGLEAELAPPARSGLPTGVPRALSIPPSKDGRFGLRLEAQAPGEHRLRVKDPVTGDWGEARFEVRAVSAERRGAVRDRGLQDRLAQVSGGLALELDEAPRLAEAIAARPAEERVVKVLPLWNHWLAFALVIGLLLGEWMLRRMMELP
jgi:hypothetical protein